MLLISQSAFAKKVGVSQQAISKLVKQGRLPVDGKKLIMPDAEKAYYQIKSGIKLSDAPIVEVLPPSEKTNSDNADLQDLLNAKVKKEDALGNLHVINLAKLRGELVSIQDVNETVIAALTIVRNSFLNLPNKVSQRLEGLSAAEIQLVLEDEVNEVLTELYSLQSQYHDESGNTE